METNISLMVKLDDVKLYALFLILIQKIECPTISFDNWEDIAGHLRISDLPLVTVYSSEICQSACVNCEIKFLSPISPIVAYQDWNSVWMLLFKSHANSVYDT